MLPRSPTPGTQSPDLASGNTARRCRAERAAETRDALLTAAHRLFVANGWVGTGMRDVAVEAGVATETLYAYFSSKRVLFQAVVDMAVVGDDRPVAVADRPEFAAIGRGRHSVRTAAAARLLTAIHTRTAALAKVIREAAASDEEIADELDATRERQRHDVAAAAELIMGRAADDGRTRRLVGTDQPRGLSAAHRGVRVDARAVPGVDG